MSSLVLVFLVLSIGISAYAKTRREGTWSWRKFGLTVLVLSVLGAGVGLGVSALGRRLGSEHALLLTLLAVAIIFVGVFVLADHLRPKRGGKGV
jgi:hypothetical protein